MNQPIKITNLKINYLNYNNKIRHHKNLFLKTPSAAQVSQIIKLAANNNFWGIIQVKVASPTKRRLNLTKTKWITIKKSQRAAMGDQEATGSSNPKTNWTRTTKSITHLRWDFCPRHSQKMSINNLRLYKKFLKWTPPEISRASSWTRTTGV